MDMSFFDNAGGSDPGLIGGDLLGGTRASQDEVIKAIQAGARPFVPGSGTMDAVTPEDLSELVTEIVFKDKHTVVGKMLSTAEAKNATHRYARLLSEGGLESDFVPEGGGSQVDSDPVFDSPDVQLRQITRQYTITEMQRYIHTLAATGGVQGRKAYLRTMQIRKAERNLDYSRVFGDGTLNGASYDGMITLVRAAAAAAGTTDEWIRDLRGEELTPEFIDDLVVDVFNSAGEPTHLLTSPNVVGRLSQRQLAFRRDGVSVGQKASPIIQGQRATGLLSSTDLEIGYKSSIVMQPEFHTFNYVPAGIGTNQPAQPVIAAAGAGAPGLGQVSQWAVGDAGTYSYRIVAYHGTRGQSVPVTSADIPVGAGEMVTGEIDDAAILNAHIDHYKIWRRRGTGPFQYMTSVAKGAFGVNTTFFDLNDDIPGTSYAILFNPDPEYVQQVRLGNKNFYEIGVPLGANSAMPTSWLYFLIKFEALIVRAPSWFRIIKNCAARG